NNWNGLDFFIFLILALNAIQGMSRGTAKEILSMMCLSIALIFSIKFTLPLTNFINSSPLAHGVLSTPMIQRFMHAIGAGSLTLQLLHQIMYSISLLVCFVGIFCVLEATLTSSNVSQSMPLHEVLINRKVSSAIGLTRGYIINLIFLSIFTLHISGADNKFVRDSFFAKLFHTQTVKLDRIIRNQKPEDYKEIYKNQPKLSYMPG
ncbi:MAG TPA: CvpA family protein, partial [Gammaproteobacteria bacterium]|nr:CvpA family protein [Gammaproteobacteria bacterium]